MKTPSQEHGMLIIWNFISVKTLYKPCTDEWNLVSSSTFYKYRPWG